MHRISIGFYASCSSHKALPLGNKQHQFAVDVVNAYANFGHSLAIFSRFNHEAIASKAQGQDGDYAILAASTSAAL